MSEQRVERVTPYGDCGSGGKARQVEQMFDAIAPAYDFMNRAMTLGIDRWWRRVAVRRVARAVPPRAVLLDVATGTGDFALQLWRMVKPAALTGIDLSEGMLAVARQKAGGIDGITFQRADCLALPFDDHTFDAVTAAFGVRNFEHLDRGYAEMARVLRPGGMLCVVELSVPQNRVVRWFYNLYTRHFIPWLGGLRSGDRAAYRYLPASIEAVPQGRQMLALMESAGLAGAAYRRLTLGTCTIYTAMKPA